MITRFQVQNFKALRDVTLELTPIHVLIGPNDSGKTSILEALRALCLMTQSGALESAFQSRWTGPDLVWERNPTALVKWTVGMEEGEQHVEYSISCRFPAHGSDVLRVAERVQITIPPQSVIDISFGSVQSSSVANLRTAENHPHQGVSELVSAILRGAHFYRWNPTHLGLPVAFGFQQRFGLSSSGFGLAIFLDDILAYDHQRYQKMEEQFQRFFPNVLRIRLQRENGFVSPQDSSPSQLGYGIYFELAKQGILLP